MSVTYDKTPCYRDDGPYTNRGEVAREHLVVAAARLMVNVMSVPIQYRGLSLRTVTFMTPSHKRAVVPNQVPTPATRPVRAPTMQPVLFAFRQATPIAMGQTAPPRMTPMKVYSP